MLRGLTLSSTVCVGALVHVVLSKAFPDRTSIISESVYAHDVLAERSQRALHASSGEDVDEGSEKDKDGPSSYVSEV